MPRIRKRDANKANGTGLALKNEPLDRLTGDARFLFSLNQAWLDPVLLATARPLAAFR